MIKNENPYIQNLQMRLWSLHPRYLDALGITILWHEALMAREIIQEHAQSIKFYPQLIRFTESRNPIDSIDCYLRYIWKEGNTRQYNFDKDKIGNYHAHINLATTTGQINYEFHYLMRDLKKRSPQQYEKLCHLSEIDPHPMFSTYDGDIHDWEPFSNIK